MKRSLAIAFLGLVALGVAYLASCSEPLEVNNSPSTNPPLRVDTVFIFDTLTPNDSSLPIDTIRITDTIRLTDTTHDIDTVIDTIRRIDTTIRFDTIRILDPHYVYDTVTLIDTMTTVDTVVHTVVDTLVHSDTVTVTHTVVKHDTVRVTDTTTLVDTLVTTDTVVRVDTVKVGDPTACNPEPFCGKLAACDKELLWLFRNEAGNYHLEFSGYADKDQPLQTIVVTINGVAYYWKAAEKPEWDFDMALPANTTIRIGLTKPPAYGHEIHICLQMTKI